MFFKQLFTLLPIAVSTAEHMNIAAEVLRISVFDPGYIPLSPQRIFEAFNIQLQRNILVYQPFYIFRRVSVGMSDDYPYIIPIVEAFDRLPYQIGPL